MKIIDILKDRRSFSFEVFPPKMDQSLEPLSETLTHLKEFKPDFISCTYGAGGTNKGRSEEVCSMIKRMELNPMTHFTCIGNTKGDILNIVERYRNLGVKNILALRGDIPHGLDGTNGDFSHGDQLVAFLRENYPDLCIAAACYPEKHIEALTMEDDLKNLKRKVSCGADFLMTQLCYDVDNYARFREMAGKYGVDLPVVVGIMPVLNKDGVIRMTVTNGCSIPMELAEIIGRYGDAPQDFKKAGKEYTVKLIDRYKDAGVEGIHIYSLNKYKDVADIIEASNIRR